MKLLKLLPGNKRPKIYFGAETIVQRWRDRLLGTSAMLPPRYGKSDLIRGSILEMRALNSPPGIVIVPWINLADQIKDRGKINAMYQRFGVPPETKFLVHRCQRMKASGWWKQHSGTPDLISITLGLALANEPQFVDGIEEMAEMFEAPVPLFVDECHLTKKKKAWGRLVEKCGERGGYIVALTGTPVPGMPRFDDEYEEWNDVTYKLHRRKVIDGETKYFEQVYEGEKRQVTEIKADIEVLWSEAWSEGALARVNQIDIDCEVIDHETNESLGQLSELTQEELLGGRLRDVVESDDWTARAAECGVKRLLSRRRKQPKSQMLICTGYDFANGNGEHNRHAESFKRAIQQVCENLGHNRNHLRIGIATSVDSDGNPNEFAIEVIKAFQRGDLDVLIVKLMGVVGTDVPSCKVEIYASPMRKGPMAKQALTRCLTIWDEDGRAADLIVPKDQGMMELCKAMFEDQGGRETETNVELVEENEVPEPEPRGAVKAKASKVSSYSDETGGYIEGDYEETLAVIKSKYHVGSLSDAEIIQNHERGGYSISDDDKVAYRSAREKTEAIGIKDLDEGLDILEGRFGQKAKDLVNEWCRKRGISYGTHRELWLGKVRDLAKAAKRHVGIRGRVQDVDDAEILRRLISALDIVAPVELGNA